MCVRAGALGHITHWLRASAVVLAGTLVACGDTPTESPPGPSRLIMVSGNEQTGAAGQPLAQPIVVRVLDSRGRGRSGVEIYWVVSLGRGYVTTATSSTDSEGQASAIWTLGFLATTQTVSAVAGDTTVSPAERRVTFSATAIGVANRLELVSGDNQTALTDDSLSLPLVVRLVNENGVGIGGVGVYWLSNGGHVFPRGSPLTDADGYARATWIAGLSAGAQTASANVYDFVTPGPLFSVQFTATVQLPPQALTWTREAQGVTTANLFGVWGSSATDVFVVGESGTILHYDGVGWIKQASGTTARLRDVWGTGPTNVYVAGDSGILHYDGNGWSPERIDPTLDTTLAAMPRFSSIWGTSPSDIFTVNRSAFFHFDGATWSATPMGPTNDPETSWHVWGLSPIDAYAAGVDLWHFDGVTWRRSVDGTYCGVGSNLAYFDIWGATGDDLFAVGWDCHFGSGLGTIIYGWIRHYDGSQWNTVLTTGPLRAISGWSATDIVAVGNEIRHYDGQRWRREGPEGTLSLGAVWGSSALNVYTVGSYGFILHGVR